MSAAAATVLAAVVSAIVALIVALFNAWFGRGGRRADVADKITKASETLLSRMDTDKAELTAKCHRCETKLDATNAAFEAHKSESRAELKKVYRVLRTLVLAMDRGDATATESAKAAAWDLINN